MTVEKVVNIMKKNYPTRTVKEVRKINDDYLVTAVETTDDVDYNNPFFVVMENSECYPINPLADMETFGKMMQVPNELE